MEEENNKTSYEIVFDFLLNNGYSEMEGEELLSRVIEEQRIITKLANQINQVLKNNRTKY